MTWKRRSNNKYNAAKVVWKDEVYDSRREMEYAMWLESERQAGRIKWWRRQIPVRLEVNGKLVARINIDFKLEYLDGHQEFHEVKGKATQKEPYYRLKFRLFQALNPDVIYKVIN